MPKCPHCEYPGQRFPYAATKLRADGTSYSDFGTAFCRTCSGSNQVSDQLAHDVTRAERLRRHRIDVLRISVRTRAAELALDPKALSAIEHGRVTDELRETAEQLYAEVSLG